MPCEIAVAVYNIGDVNAAAVYATAGRRVAVARRLVRLVYVY